MEQVMSELPVPTSPPHTVLVIEDDIVVRQACTMLLEDAGFDVVAASDGIDGLRKFHQIKPDIVLTDIIMPEKEGISLITDLRRSGKDVKIIAMSGGGRIGNMDFVTLATALGANGGLYKPFDDLELIETIRASLEPASAAQMQASAQIRAASRGPGAREKRTVEHQGPVAADVRQIGRSKQGLARLPPRQAAAIRAEVEPSPQTALNG
jgi:DNA-binding response OmpR family regulator